MSPLQCFADTFVCVRSAKVRSRDPKRLGRDVTLKVDRIAPNLSDLTVQCETIASVSLTELKCSLSRRRHGDNTSRTDRGPAFKWRLSTWLQTDCLAHILLTAISLIVYWPSIHNQFVFDDFPAIVRNREVTSGFGRWTTLWTTDFWGTPMHHVSLVQTLIVCPASKRTLSNVF
jgi:hypothetical protein